MASRPPKPDLFPKVKLIGGPADGWEVARINDGIIKMPFRATDDETGAVVMEGAVLYLASGHFLAYDRAMIHST